MVVTFTMLTTWSRVRPKQKLGKERIFKSHLRKQDIMFTRRCEKARMLAAFAIDLA